MGVPQVPQNPRVFPALLSKSFGPSPRNFHDPFSCPMNVVSGEAVARRQLSQWQWPNQFTSPRSSNPQAPQRQ